jgi:HK97 family phage major capsid protein
MVIKAFRHTGASIKAIDDYRVGGYLVRFTNENDRDLHNEWFSKDTDFWMERDYPIKGSRVLLEHGLDDFVKVMPIGIIDLVQEDEIGLYVEAKLKDRAEYERMLKEMQKRKSLDIADGDISRKAELAVKAIKAIVDTGKVGWSSGALPQSVRVNEQNGHIDSWAIIEGSLTFTPAESNGTEIAPIKSALEQLSDFLSLQPVTHHAPTDAQHREANADTVIETHSITKTSRNDNKGTEMALTPEMAKEIIALLQGMFAEQGVPEPEAVAMASDIEEEMKAEDAKLPEEEQAKAVDEELVKAWTGRALAKYEAALAKRANLSNVAKNAINNYKQNAPVKDSAFLGGYTGGNGATVKNNHISVSAPNRFPHWEPEDYAFAMVLDRQIRAKGKRGILNNQGEMDDFLREFADKATPAVAQKRFANSPTATKAFNAIKANELGQSTLASYGDEWVPDLWDSNLWMKARIDTVGLPQFRVVEMPSNPYELPLEGTDNTMYYVSETSGEAQLTLADTNSPIPDSKIGTGKVQLSAKKFGTRVMFSAELEEDSIIPVLNIYRSQAETAFMEGIDDVIFNGDTETGTTNINSDGSALGATSRYLALNGLRKDTFTNSSNQIDALAASPTLAMIRRARFLLARTVSGKLGGLRIFVNPETEGKLLGIDEFLTVDKAGTTATAQTGTIGYIDRIPVLVTDQLPLTDADGKVTAAGNAVSRGTLVMAYVPHWVVGFRRRLSNDLSFIPYYDSYVLTMTARMDFKPRDTDSAAAIINLGIG